MLQHEDGFASGLRVATEYLSASLPFPVRHAERDLRPKATDKAVSLVLILLEFVRRLLETPYAWLMSLLSLGLWALLIGAALVAGTAGALGASHVEKQLDEAMQGMRTIKRMWDKSAGKKVPEKRKLP